MIIILVLFLYWMLFFVAIYNLIIQYKREKHINTFICFQAAFILYYIFIPILFHITSMFYTGHLTGFAFMISNADTYDVIYAFAYTSITYMIILLVYYTRISTKSSSSKLTRIMHFNCETDYINKSNVNYLNAKKFHIAITAGFITLAIGIMAEIIIANSLGGVIKAISMGDVLRAFGSDNSKYIPQSRLFTMVLMVSSLASTYFFVYAHRIYKKLYIKLMIAISLLASLFYLLVNAGRLPILLFVLPFFVDFVFRKTKHPFVFMGLFFVISLVLLGALDDLFFYLSYGYIKESSTNILSILNEFSLPYLNLLNIDKINAVYGLRWGIDLVSWVVNIVPTSILKIFGLTKITTGYTFITEYYYGSNGLGGIPTDLITLLSRQFGILGLIIGSSLLAVLCKYMDKKISKIFQSNFIFIQLRISSIMFIIVPYADLDSFVRNRYDMIMVFLFTIVISNVDNISKIKRNFTKSIDL